VAAVAAVREPGMADRRPDISVQVPVRNPGAAFAVFLGSLGAQETAITSFELIVVDDGSKVPIADSFDLHPDGCSRVEVIRLEGGGSRARARNAALEASTAPVSFMTDSDLRLASGLLEQHVLSHRDGLPLVIRGLRINAWSPTSTPWQRWFDTRAGGMDGPPAPMPWRHFITGNTSLPRSLALGVGGFDEAITRYGGEDTEFGYRLSLAGASFLRDPSLRTWHLDNVTVRRHSEKMHEYGENGLRYTIRKYPELLGLLGTGWIDRRPGTRPSPREAVLRVLVLASISRPVYRSVLGFMERAGGPSFLFAYLSVGACLRGFAGMKP
jgi:glycosyltransferase involved in cell wall biosynthesis